MADGRRAVDERVGGIVFPDRFRVERVIGRGGAGVVFAAQDRRLQRRVAVKVLDAVPGADPAAMLRHEEARVLAALAHPHLIAVYDTFLSREGDRTRAFLVLERVDGPDLAQYLRAAVLTPQQVAEIGEQLCSALAYVHDRGFLHRDVKPSNVLLSFDSDGELNAKLSDFGTAALVQGASAEGDYTVGTAAYLSPEQAEGLTLSEASDVYALGLVLLEAATGEVAFTGTVVEAAMARLDEDPSVPDHLPAPLREVLLGMVHRDPAARLGLRAARHGFRDLRRALELTPPAPAAAASAPAEAEGREETAELFLPQEQELTQLLEVTTTAMAASGAALVEAQDGRFRHRVAHRLPELATERLRRSPLAAAARSGAPVVSDDAHFLVASAASAESAERYLVVQLPDRETAARAAEAQLIAGFGAVAASALQLRDALRRALFAR